MKKQQVESRLSRLVEWLQSHLPIHDQRAMHGFFSAPRPALHRAQAGSGTETGLWEICPENQTHQPYFCCKRSTKMEQFGKEDLVQLHIWVTSAQFPKEYQITTLLPAQHCIRHLTYIFFFKPFILHSQIQWLTLLVGAHILPFLFGTVYFPVCIESFSFWYPHIFCNYQFSSFLV